MVDFWVKLHLLDVEEQMLTAAMQSFCTDDGECAIEAHHLSHCITSLYVAASTAPSESEATVARAAAAKGFADGLSAQLGQRLPELKQRQLVEVARLAATPAGGGCSSSLWRSVMEEVDRRLPSEARSRVIGLRRASDFDDLVTILAAFRPAFQETPIPAAEASSPSSAAKSADLAQRTAQLLVESLPKVLEMEPKTARRRLAEAADGIATLNPSAREAMLGTVRTSLHRDSVTQAAIDDAKGATTTASELAFAFAALYEGRLPLDVAARLSRILGDALPGRLSSSNSSAGSAAEEAETLLSPLQGAKLWAFLLASRHLLTPTSSMALRLAQEAPALEALLQRLELKARVATGKPRFELAEEPRALETLSLLRAAIAIGARDASTAPGSRHCQERFEVPGTPYLVDFALPERRLLLLVPRLEHSSAPGLDGSPAGLSGAGALAEGVLAALGWKLRWVWPHEWDARLAPAAEHSGKSDPALTESLAALLSDGVSQAVSSEGGEVGVE